MKRVLLLAAALFFFHAAALSFYMAWIHQPFLP